MRTDKPLAVRVKAVLKIGETRSITRLMKFLRAKRDDLEECVHDIDGLDLIVGVRTYNGHGWFDRTKYSIERYE